jgi:hypothetical protein
MGGVGEFGKTLSASKRRIVEIHKAGSRSGCKGKVQIYEKG